MAATALHNSTPKSLDQKLAAIHADPSGSREFIIADAKDADMAFGLAAPGRSPEHHAGEGRFRTLEEYRAQIREIVRQGVVDIMLMSTSTSDALTIGERLFDNSHVTPAIRANDTTDIWAARGALLLTLARGGLRIEEYSPAEVKSAVTGSGRADKEQVARMVRLLLGLGEEGFPADATDALAVALCSSQRQSLRRLTERIAVSK